MKNKKLKKAIKEWATAVHQNEAEEGIVGYALFDTVKRAFVSFENHDYGMSNTYTGNVEVAYVADTRGEAFNIMVTILDDYFDVKIVPLIWNVLFGLSPKPGSLNDDFFFK
ncbi:hypothetical protein N7G03_000744 [Salmonella enterica]|nr:hypothetical protein [Salmonella enterica]EEE3045327.1 hypothetical protein [Salmonella enterica subsp. enterica serovar Duisburg]EAM3911993.1 hypothetical protein [Salmonella enterica]EAN2234594.1 hypothetical protein [Salmonella enterica]EAN6204413.1 hypothetical protein [Salmonella enterica]